jgi:hypothetical protein
MKLNDRALLVQLSISTWSANKLDKQISAETTRAKGAMSGTIRSHKTLLPMCDLLDNIRQKANLIRTRFYDNTLPWGVKGIQILPTANYLTFMTEFRKERSEYEYLVKQFVPAYPQLVHDAQQYLGTSYNPEDYPDARDIADKFKMDMQIMPVPNDDFRVDIADEELGRIQQEVEARVKQAGQQAMQEVWQRLYDKVTHMADRLSKLDDPKTRFHESTLEHVTDLCELLPRLNVLDDPNLEAMRQEVEGKLSGLSKDSVVLSPTFRQTKIDEANDIAARMAAFMGGLN